MKAVEQAGWNLPPEPGLFRITWDADRAAEIRTRAGTTVAPEGLDAYTAELWQLDGEADRELKARGECANGFAKLHTLLEGNSRTGPISGIFKCRESLF